MKQSTLIKSGSLITLIAVLSACGGGGGGEQVSVASADASDAATANLSDEEKARRSRTPAPAPAATYTLSVTSPQASATVSGSIQVTGSGPGFKNVEVFSATGAVLGQAAPSANGDFSVQVNTAALSSGTQVLTIVAWDSLPGQAFTQTQQVTRTVNVVQGTTTAPAPAPAPAPATVGVKLTDHGGVCNGSTDNSAAIARGLADAKAKNQPLLIPAGQCNFSKVIELQGTKIVGQGPTSVLYATNYAQSAIFMYGAGPEIRNVKLTGPLAPQRMAPWEYTRVVPFGATDFVIDGVTIEGSSAGGIQLANAATRGRITNNVVRNTLSDSIHITDMASHILVEGNLIENSGDDGIAVVSYREHPYRVNNITARNNRVLNNRYGRNMSVVGGQDITYTNNYLEGNSGGAACLYLVQEGNQDWYTYSPMNVLAERNTIKNCGSQSTGHGGVMIYSDGQEAVTNVTVRLNDLVQGNQTGIRYFGPMANVKLEQNRYSGSGSAYSGAEAGVSVTPYSSGTVGYVAP